MVKLKTHCFREFASIKLKGHLRRQNCNTRGPKVDHQRCCQGSRKNHATSWPPQIVCARRSSPQKNHATSWPSQIVCARLPQKNHATSWPPQIVSIATRLKPPCLQVESAESGESCIDVNHLTIVLVKCATNCEQYNVIRAID